MTAAPGRRNGDTGLFDAVYASHSRAVYALLFAQVQDAGVAADLVQDTFVRVWSHLGDLRAVPDDRRLYWILRIARNLARDHYRRQTVRRQAEHSCDGRTLSVGSDPQEEFQVNEMQNAIDSAIRSLPLTLREPLTLSAMAGLNSTEIAAILGRPSATVRYQIAEARRRIAREVGLLVDGARKGGENAG